MGHACPRVSSWSYLLLKDWQHAFQTEWPSVSECILQLVAAGDELWQNTGHHYGRPDVSFLTQPNIVIARVIGIIAIAAGFLLGIEGLNQPDSIWLPIALTLIVTGLCAQVYAFYRTIMYKMPSRNTPDR